MRSMRSMRRAFSMEAIQGMPPPEVASMKKPTPDSSAWAQNSGRNAATTALFAVTTCLPAARLSMMKVWAGSRPPMASTTHSMESSETMSAKS